jgi:hypothetical protein
LEQLGLRLKEHIKVALTLDSVELLARALENLDESGTNLSPPPSTSCAIAAAATGTGASAEDKRWDNGEDLLDALASVSLYLVK